MKKAGNTVISGFPAHLQKIKVAGAEGFEPSARGFGDHCSTN